MLLAYALTASSSASACWITFCARCCGMTPDPARQRPADLPAWFPKWASQIADLFFSGTTAAFVLHGNVHDLVRLPVAGIRLWETSAMLSAMVPWPQLRSSYSRIMPKDGGIARPNRFRPDDKTTARPSCPPRPNDRACTWNLFERMINDA